MKSTVIGIGTIGSLVLHGWNRTFACTVCTNGRRACWEVCRSTDECLRLGFLLTVDVKLIWSS